MAAELKRGEEIEMHIRRIREIQTERGESMPPPSYH
jgi:hypothetical protein